jgi:formylglycine-generating enzyme required for sulfatase activity
MERTSGPILPENGSAGFSGKLRSFPLLDIIQMACVARRDGRLRVRRYRETGEIVLRAGRIIHAATKAKSGEPALLEVLCWTKGNFEFAPLPPNQLSPRTIAGRWEQVLMDAVRQRDELVSEKLADEPRTPSLLGEDKAAELLQRIAKENRCQRRRQYIRKSISLVLIVLFVGVGIWLLAGHSLRSEQWQLFIHQKVAQLFGPQLSWKKLAGEKVPIPAGPFWFQDNQQVDIPAFNIDSTEVTIWQYQEFLDAVGHDNKYDHPNQRLGKGHSNPSWEAYAKAAFSGTEFKGVRLNPNFPAVYLDWFDAYAFAKWKNRRLPSEVEWEKAGRGTDGRKYPWGDTFMSGTANLYRGAREAAVWSEVGGYSGDISPYGVRDLAGNVSEWTASDDGSGSPVVRGGNFISEDGQLTRRVVGLSPYTIDERIGFRTAGDATDLILNQR